MFSAESGFVADKRKFEGMSDLWLARKVVDPAVLLGDILVDFDLEEFEDRIILRSGRKVAREQAVIPEAGSMVLHINKPVCSVSMHHEWVGSSLP